MDAPRPSHAFAKGALIGVGLAGLSLSAAAYYSAARPDRGWLLELMTSIAMEDPLGGAFALGSAVIASALVAGALLGRYVVRLEQDPRRVNKMMFATATAYFGSAVTVAAVLGIVRSIGNSSVECVPCLALCGIAGAGLFLPITAVPLAAGVLLLERWTQREGSAPGLRRLLAVLFVGVVGAIVALGNVAINNYRSETWTLALSGAGSCTIQRGASRGSVRSLCGRPTDLGREQHHVFWTLRGPVRCDTAEDAYGEWLVLYDCHGDVARVAPFAVHGIHRVFADDFVDSTGTR